MSPSEIYKRSSEYHRFPKAGKLAIVPTKPLSEQSDLALAYSPGVAGPCLEIADDPAQAAYLTARSNLIAVISNGTAVLGLGNIGPLASKPVMEGKAVLFKKFAGLDVFDIEINETDPDKLIEIIAALEPTFGGINLEDIKAPECFYIEKKLSERMNIPVFHDDQHGTAIIVSAAVLNGLKVVGKNIEDVRLVTSGAGAAAIACVDLLVSLGMKRENIIISDSLGIVYAGRQEQMDENKAGYATTHAARTLAEAMIDADIFLGLSVANVVTADMAATMAPKPLILALANPVPEILPDEVKKVRDDAIIATGRSDFPNQVNNVLCFPFIFRGALDVGATTINESMKLACVRAIADLAQAEGTDVVSNAYGGEIHRFGPDYIIPKPFDPRLIVSVSMVVAQAAMDTGVATRPIQDMESYRHQLESMVYQSGLVMRPIYAQAKEKMMRVVFAEGEEERVLRAAQIMVDDGLCHPILIGRPDVINRRIERLGLRLQEGENIALIDPNKDSRYTTYWQTYHQIMERSGVSPDVAKMLVRTNPTIIAALAVYLGDADTMIAGTIGRYDKHLGHMLPIIGIDPDCENAAALSLLVMEDGPLFFCDPYVNDDPNACEIADMTLLAAEQIKKYGITPKIALVSQSSFGSKTTPSACKMQEAFEILSTFHPDLEIEGEMQADAALCDKIRTSIFPNSRLKGAANLLVMPSLDVANVAFNLAKVLGKGLPVGPLLMGTLKPGHIVTPSTTVRGLIDMCVLAAVDAQTKAQKES